MDVLDEEIAYVEKNLSSQIEGIEILGCHRKFDNFHHQTN